MRRALALTLLLLAAGTVPAGAHELTYRKARAAAQRQADAFAGMRASVESMIRLSRHRFGARAEWSYVDPTGCEGCVYDEATGTFRDGPEKVQCSVEIVVRYRSHRSRRPVAVVDGHSCY